MVNFDTQIDRRHTDSLKWDTYRADFPQLSGDDDVLPVWVADMDFLCPQPVIDAVVERAKFGIYAYLLYIGINRFFAAPCGAFTRWRRCVASYYKL